MKTILLVTLLAAAALPGLAQSTGIYIEEQAQGRPVDKAIVYGCEPPATSTIPTAKPGCRFVPIRIEGGELLRIGTELVLRFLPPPTTPPTGTAVKMEKRTEAKLFTLPTNTMQLAATPIPGTVEIHRQNLLLTPPGLAGFAPDWIISGRDITFVFPTVTGGWPIGWIAIVTYWVQVP